ncbi:MAG: HIT domain-containing protein [Nanoarchaeota archaeon]|nr:HIT domain-containing protein [Nanoarchaeota archaeon]
MAQIYETKNFIVESREQPFITREDGGHIRILMKDPVSDRTKLSASQAIELMRLTMLVGEAMQLGLKRRGIDIIRINYEDLGNWAAKKNEKPDLHIHIFGRAKGAKYQPWPEAVQLPDRGTGFYDKFEPLNEKDNKEIRKKIEKLLKEEKYSFERWGIN